MKIKIVAGFVIGAVLTAVIMITTNVGAVMQNPEPFITNIAPISGGILGGEVVTITGGYFNEITEVTFDGIPSHIQSVSANSIVVITPAHSAEFVDVSVTNSIGTGIASSSYEYLLPPPPSISSLSPASGPIEGGTTVTIYGSNLTNTQSVTFDGVAASVTSNSDSQLVVSTPPHIAGMVDVVLITQSGDASIVGGYEYVDSTPPPVPMPPSISSLTPNEGPVAGGTEVTITGTNLATVTNVTFGGLEAVIVSSTETEVVVTSPAHAIGPVDITATNPDGSVTFAGGFTYISSPLPPTYIYCNWHDNCKNWTEDKGNQGKNKKALVCHQQSKPKNFSETLCLPLEAIPAHLAHGDKLGYCDGKEGKGKEPIKAPMPILKTPMPFKAPVPIKAPSRKH